jgi:hypothetical protein
MRSKKVRRTLRFLRFVILKPDCDWGIIREMRAREQKQRTKKKAHAAAGSNMRLE